MNGRRGLGRSTVRYSAGFRAASVMRSSGFDVWEIWKQVLARLSKLHPGHQRASTCAVFTPLFPVRVAPLPTPSPRLIIGSSYTGGGTKHSCARLSSSHAFMVPACAWFMFPYPLTGPGWGDVLIGPSPGRLHTA